MAHGFRRAPSAWSAASPAGRPLRTVRTGAFAPPQPDIDEGHGVADEEPFEMEHDDAANLNGQDDRAAAEEQQPAYAPNQAAVAVLGLCGRGAWAVRAVPGVYRGFNGSWAARGGR